MIKHLSVRILAALAGMAAAYGLDITEGATVAMTTTQGNGSPTTYATLTEDPVLPGEVVLNAFSEMPATMTWTISTAAANGTATVINHPVSMTPTMRALVRYVPYPDFNGSDSFVVTVTDPSNNTASTTVNVTVGAVNDAPVISDGSLTPAGATWTTTATAFPSGSWSWYGLAASSDGSLLIGATSYATDGGYIYISRDSGVTWSLRVGDRQRKWTSSACSDDGVYMYAVCESSSSFFMSSTSGRTWSEINVVVGGSTIAAQTWRGLACSADGRYLTLGADGGYLYTFDRNNFSGGWTQRGVVRNWKAIAMTPDATMQVAADGADAGAIWRSTDSGATWQQTLAPASAWSSVAITSSGKMIAPKTNGNIYVSTDFGNNWDELAWGTQGGGTDNSTGYWYEAATNPSGTSMLISGSFYEPVVYSNDSGATYSRPSPNVYSQSSELSNDGGKFHISPLSGSPKWSQGRRRVTMSEDGGPTAFALTLSASDAESDTLTWSISSAAGNGTATASGTGTSKAIGYAPTADWNGTDHFTVTVTDANGATDAIDVEVVVQPVNDAPTAAAQSVTTNEDTAVGITLAGADVDGSIASYAIATSPAKGVLSGTAPNLTYTPTANLSGSDSFTFTVTDNGGATSTAATVSISITAVNDMPTANAQSLSLLRNTSLAITLSGSDSDGTVGGYTYAQPAHGTVTGTAPNVTYTPTTGYDGADSFTFFAYDNQGGDSAPATISLTVLPNAVPVATAQSITTDEDTAVAITLAGTDTDGTIASYDVAANPTKGVLSGTAPNLTYTPNADENGSDSFTFTVTDNNSATSGTATVSITITAVNDAPTATAQSVTTNEDAAVAITLAGTDIDGSVASYAVTTDPTKGVLSGTAPDLTYTPNADANGSDSFAFTVTDNSGATSAAATVSITITPVNDAPTATAQAITTDEDTAAAITLAGTDIDGTIAAYTVTADPTNGVLSGTAPNLTYTPNANATGSDSFSFTVTDQFEAVSAAATVTITIAAANDTPTATAQSVTTNEDTAVAITLAGTDIDGTIASYAVTADPTKGVLSGTAPNLTYTPNADANGSDSFAFTVTDNSGATSAAATVSITITPVNDAPTATPQSVTTDEDTAVAITLAGTDIDGSIAAYTVATSPTLGTLSGTAPNLTYTPHADANGSDSFTITVTDNSDAPSVAATIAITVTPVNDAPTATAQSVTTDEDTAVAITLAGTDIDGSIASYAITAGPAKGVLSGTLPNLTFTPNANANGSDSFAFTVTDNGSATSTAATVSLTITPVNDAPNITNGAILAMTRNSAGGPGAYTGSITATDADGDTLTWSVTTPASQGVVSVGSTGGTVVANYTANSGFRGSDLFVITVSDGHGGSDTITASFTITDTGVVIGNATASNSGTVVGGSGNASTLGCGTGGLGAGLIVLLMLGLRRGGRRVLVVAAAAMLTGPGLGAEETLPAVPAAETAPATAATAEPAAPAPAAAETAPAAAPEAQAASRDRSVRLGFSLLPRRGRTDLWVTDTTNDQTTASTNQRGRFEQNTRVDLAVVRQSALGGSFGHGHAFGLTCARIASDNDLGSVVHQHAGLAVEPMLWVRPADELQIEAGLSVAAFWAWGDMLVSRDGGITAEREQSSYGVGYDATVQVRPVWRMASGWEAWLQASWVLLRQERLYYEPDGLEVLEANTWRGFAAGAGVGYRF